MIKYRSENSEPWAFGEESRKENLRKTYLYESTSAYRMLPTILIPPFINLLKQDFPNCPSKFWAISYPNRFADLIIVFSNQYLFCDRLLIAPVEKL